MLTILKYVLLLFCSNILQILKQFLLLTASSSSSEMFAKEQQTLFHVDDERGNAQMRRDVMGGQCDQIGLFLKVLGDKIRNKGSLGDWQLLGQGWKTSLFVQNCCCYFLGNFRKHLGYFLLQHLVTLINLWRTTWALFFPRTKVHLLRVSATVLSADDVDVDDVTLFSQNVTYHKSRKTQKQVPINFEISS